MSQGYTEILMFQVGARIYAAQVDDVRRIAPADWDEAGTIGTSALGRPFLAQRGIVVACAGGDQILAVDQVLGVRQVAEADLRPLPPLAAHCLGSSAVTGLALLDEAPTPLVDLATLIEEELRRGAAATTQGRHRA